MFIGWFIKSPDIDRSSMDPFLRYAAEDTTHDVRPGWRNEVHDDADEIAIAEHIGRIFTNMGVATAWRANNEETYIDDLESADQLDAIKATVTYEEILDNTAPDPTTIMTDSIIISSNGFEIDTASDEQRLTIARYILMYMFNAADGFSPFFTFDAAQAQIGKIFRDHPNARGLMIPQNIADSATSSFMQLGEQPNVYAFPKNNASNFISRWNTFSPGFQFIYNNNGYNENNPYGFTYSITGGGQTVPYTFGPGQQQGASLDYLLSLTLAAINGTPFARVLLPSNCLNIGTMPRAVEAAIRDSIRTNQQSPFIDMKRSGDGDQADGAAQMDAILNYVVLVTGDRLLSVLMRLMKRRCIYQYHQTLTISRGVRPPLQDPAAAAAYEASKQQAYIEKYTQLYQLFTDPRLPPAIDAYIASMVLPARVGVVNVVKTLLSIKLADMIAGLQSFRDSIVAAALPYVPPNQDQINSMIGICQTINIPRSEIGAFLQMFLNPPFNYTKDLSFLNYSFKSYKALSSAIVALNAKLANTRTERAPVNFYTLANQDKGYNASLREILESMPSIDGGPRFIMDSETTRVQVTPILAALDSTMAGGYRKQRGGALEDVRESIFREICSVAATFIRAMLSPHIQHVLALSALQNLVYSSSIGDPAIGINFEIAQQYISTINEENIAAAIAELTPLAQTESDQVIASFASQDAANMLITKLDEIHFLWFSKTTENDIEPKDPIVWWQLLNPFLDDGTINGGHIYNSELLKRDPLRDIYIFKEVPEIPTMLTLAIINDILEGAVGRQTSIFTQLFVKGGTLPTSIAKIRIRTPSEWMELQRLIKSIYRAVSTGQISKEILTLFGGSRKTRRRRGGVKRVKRKTIRR